MKEQNSRENQVKVKENMKNGRKTKKRK